jgi:hypothetical protein
MMRNVAFRSVGREFQWRCVPDWGISSRHLLLMLITDGIMVECFGTVLLGPMRKAQLCNLNSEAHLLPTANVSSEESPSYDQVKSDTTAVFGS